jgi:electron transport complex protein RnfG
MAKKLESTLVNMIASLVLISMVMSASLAFVYLKTKGPIEAAALKKENDAIRMVVPPFDNDPAQSRSEKNGVVVYKLTQKGNLVGYAVKTYTDKGFGGHIEIMVGFLPDGSIRNIMVLQHKETPGLGSKMTDPKFSHQFLGKNPSHFALRVKKDGGQVDAITAATISSRAYCDALQRAYDALPVKPDSAVIQSLP